MSKTKARVWIRLGTCQDSAAAIVVEDEGEFLPHASSTAYSTIRCRLQKLLVHPRLWFRCTSVTLIESFAVAGDGRSAGHDTKD
jgi:hypothetical protein